jgi:hypothetical protein
MCTRSHTGSIVRLLLATALVLAALQAEPVNAAAANPDSGWSSLLKDTLRSVTSIVGHVPQTRNRVAPAITLMGVRG